MGGSNSTLDKWRYESCLHDIVNKIPSLRKYVIQHSSDHLAIVEYQENNQILVVLPHMFEEIFKNDKLDYTCLEKELKELIISLRSYIDEREIIRCVVRRKNRHEFMDQSNYKDGLETKQGFCIQCCRLAVKENLSDICDEIESDTIIETFNRAKPVNGLTKDQCLNANTPRSKRAFLFLSYVLEKVNLFCTFLEVFREKSGLPIKPTELKCKNCENKDQNDDINYESTTETIKVSISFKENGEPVVMYHED